jgi:hypothetical protein
MRARFLLQPWLLLTAAALSVAACAGPTGTSPTAQPPKPAGDPRLAQTRLPDLLDRPQTLSQYLAPRGLLLVFVDLNCPASEQTLTELPAIASKLETRFGLPAVVVDVDNEAAKVRPYYQAKQLAIPVLYDESQRPPSAGSSRSCRPSCSSTAPAR